MSKKTVIGAFLGGAAIGAISLLFAPKKGSELRKDAQEKFAQVKEKAQSTVEKYRKTENEVDIENLIILEGIQSEEEVESKEQLIADNPSK